MGGEIFELYNFNYNCLYNNIKNKEEIFELYNFNYNCLYNNIKNKEEKKYNINMI
jgi:hypothetical protein